MKPSTWRTVAWAIFLVLAILRPGVDLIDRWLVTPCWNIPSEWNAVADVAIRTGVVDGRIGGKAAPWRQASVLPVGRSRLAIITVSDLTTSRVVFISEQYRVLAVLARMTSDPSLVTDEERGYKSLSHIWPLVEQEGRLQTLIAMAPLRSDPVRLGVFAYVALGPQDNELLFVCRLETGPGPIWGELVRMDLNGDGFDDFAVHEKGQLSEPPIAAFTWDARTHQYTSRMTDTGRQLVSWWSRTSGDRVIVPRDVAIDDAVRRIAGRFDNRGRTIAASEDRRQKAALAQTSEAHQPPWLRAGQLSLFVTAF